MIVIAIIAILAAILIPNFLHARAEAVTAACEGNEKQLATAEEEIRGRQWWGIRVARRANHSVSKRRRHRSCEEGERLHGNDSGTRFHGSYQISDAGGHDSTTTTSLTRRGRASYSACRESAYAQASGIHGN